MRTRDNVTVHYFYLPFLNEQNQIQSDNIVVYDNSSLGYRLPDVGKVGY